LIIMTHSPTIFSNHNRQAGLSLVELMISLTIGLLLLAGLTSLIVKQSSTRDELEKSSRQIENGRYAIQILHDDIQHAGYFGEYSPAASVSVAPADPCNLGAGSANSGWSAAPAAAPVAIYGYPGAATDPTAGTTCGLSNYKPNTAILVVRRTATAAVAAAAAVAGATYLQVSLCGTATTPLVFGTTGFTLQQKDCTSANPALIRQYMVNLYYISTCDVCTPSDGIPTLKMVQTGPTAAPVNIPLVEGIENLQFDYGVDSNSDGYPDNYTTAPTAADWANVMTVHTNLLARNNDPSSGYTNTTSYCLSGDAALCVAANNAYVPAANDKYKRHAYSELVRAVNPSGRRAQQ
jgi:type IV pilus assembly protein PilW